MLAEDTARTCVQYISASRGEDTTEHRAKIFHSLVLREKLHSAVQSIMESEKGGVFHPGDIYPNTGKSILEVLRLDHPGARPLTASSFEAYGGKTLASVPAEITDKTVCYVARRLPGAAGTRGADSVSLQHWLLMFGAVSTGLQHIFGEFGDWMANGRPPWAAYRVLMLGRLIFLDKCSGVRPVGVGETWRRMLAKCILSVTGVEANEACGTYQLCGGL